MSIGVLSTPRPGDVLNIIDLNSDKESEFIVRSVFDCASSFDLIDTSSGELVRESFSNLGECKPSAAPAVPLAYVPADLSPWIRAAQEAVNAERSAQHGARSVPLGNNTNNSSAFANTTKYRGNIEEKQEKRVYRRGRRRTRYKLRGVAKEILKLLMGDEEGVGNSPSSKKWRTCSCGVNRRNADRDVSVKHDDGRSHYENLILCGSVHLCPVCAYKISRKRAVQIAELIERFKEKHPNGKILLLTYTLQHALGDDLKSLIGDLKKVVDSSRSGRFHKSFVEEFNVDGYIRSLEIRGNRVNGWHPHAHELLFLTDCDLTDEELVEQIDGSLGERYRGKLEKLGHKTNKHTFDVRVTDGVEEYLTKSSMQLEISEGQSKKSKGAYVTYSPFQLLSEYDRTGDQWFADMFGEYAIATFRKRQMTFSRGLLAKYGVDDQTDEEIVNEREDRGVDVVSIPVTVWHDVINRQLSSALLDVSEENEGSTEAVANWMIDKGLIESVNEVRPRMFSRSDIYPPLDDS